MQITSFGMISLFVYLLLDIVIYIMGHYLMNNRLEVIIGLVLSIMMLLGFIQMVYSVVTSIRNIQQLVMIVFLMDILYAVLRINR